MQQTIEIELGALAPKLSKQLKAQKILINEEDLDHLQRDADAIMRCHLRGLIGDAETEKARHRLFAKIKKAVTKKATRS